jgi:plasmanylethanolamine desaturase
MSSTTRPKFPLSDEPGPLGRGLELAFIAAALTLLAVNVARLVVAHASVPWWALAVAAVGMMLADLVSGLVHWTADSWGNETWPFIGRRFLRPFRVHHTNPNDFLRRGFIDCNGDVAMINTPLLILALSLPLTSPLGQAAAVFLTAFCTMALPTNQFHQWAHQPAPVAPVSWLQDHGFILSREEHRGHHIRPHTSNYCITTGWCNRALTAIGLFPAMETFVQRVTGLRPRGEEEMA